MRNDGWMGTKQTKNVYGWDYEEGITGKSNSIWKNEETELRHAEEIG